MQETSFSVVLGVTEMGVPIMDHKLASDRLQLSCGQATSKPKRLWNSHVLSSCPTPLLQASRSCKDCSAESFGPLNVGL